MLLLRRIHCLQISFNCCHTSNNYRLSMQASDKDDSEDSEDKGEEEKEELKHVRYDI